MVALSSVGPLKLELGLRGWGLLFSAGGLLNQQGVKTSYRQLVSILVYFVKEDALSYDVNSLGELNVTGK